MKVETRRLEDLRHAPYNPRSMTPRETQKLVESIQRFGFVDPVVVNDRTGGTIVGGHQRAVAAGIAGLEEVPCVIVDLDEDRERLLNVALNRISGEWDQEKLVAVMGELDAAGAELAASGFDGWELDAILRDLRAEPGENGGPSAIVGETCPRCASDKVRRPE